MPTSASFFIIASGTKKIKKNCKKVLTFVSQNDIIIMGENNNNIKKDLRVDLMTRLGEL
jgi:hypothetical protein